MSQPIIFTKHPGLELNRLLADAGDDVSPLFIIADRNTAELCLPRLHKECDKLHDATLITIEAGDANKTLTTVETVWQRLSTSGATRRSIIINLGGGMVTDLGGFAAATFKRGVRFINIPTTLLGAVDAAVGGKTGINFLNLKNEIGVFREADAVIISPTFYATLPHGELVSGYGEVIKHALLDSTEALAAVLDYDITSAPIGQLMGILRKSVEVKRRIVAGDPYEKGIRKALNLGHTAAHSFESLAMERGATLAHGVAVAHGLICDLVMSHLRCGFPSQLLQLTGNYIRDYYPAPLFNCKDYDRLIELMRHDKKNASADAINFTLLRAPGDIVTDCTATPAEITAALDIARDLLEV